MNGIFVKLFCVGVLTAALAGVAVGGRPPGGGQGGEGGSDRPPPPPRD